METAWIVKVAVSAAPYSIDRPYDYLVPEALREAYRGQIEKQEAIVAGPTTRRSCGNFCCEVPREKSDGSSSRRRNSHA